MPLLEGTQVGQRARRRQQAGAQAQRRLGLAAALASLQVPRVRASRGPAAAPALVGVRELAGVAAVWEWRASQVRAASQVRVAARAPLGRVLQGSLAD